MSRGLARRGPRMRQVASRLLLAAVLLGGCAQLPTQPPAQPSGGGPSAPSSPPPSASAPLPTRSPENQLPGMPTPGAPISGSGSPATALAVPAATAWGRVAATRLPAVVEKGRYFVFANAGTPDGRYLIGSVMREHFLDVSGSPGDAALYEVATGRIVRMARLQSPDSRVQSASSDGRWVVWQEASDSDGFDWRVYAYSLADRRVKEVARATTVDGKAVPSPLNFVWASHGMAVWGQAVGGGVTQGDVSNSVVREADLATGSITTLATGAGSPALSWPWVAWEDLPKGGTWRTVFSNLETGWTGSMDATPPVLSIDGASVAFGAADNHSIWLIDDMTRPAEVTQVARGADETDYLEWPSLNERIVAWAQNGQSIVFDRLQHRLVSLPVAYGWASGWAAGPDLVWAETGPTFAQTGRPDWFVVLDTRTLPGS